jgi:hypothetical protein
MVCEGVLLASLLAVWLGVMVCVTVSLLDVVQEGVLEPVLLVLGQGFIVAVYVFVNVVPSRLSPNGHEYEVCAAYPNERDDEGTRPSYGTDGCCR